MSDLVKVPTGKDFGATGESRKVNMPLLRTVFDAANKADATSEDMLDEIGEALSFLHLCPPVFKDEKKTKIEDLKGYTRSDVFQTEHTFRLTVAAEMLSFLEHGSKKAMVRFEDYVDILAATVDHYSTSGGRAHYKALLNKDGSVHENAPEDFKEAFIPFSNQMGFDELASLWQAFDKAATQRRVGLRNSIANREVVLEGQPLVLKTSVGDHHYTGKATMIADPIIRAFEADNAEKAKKERDKLAAKTVKARDILKQDAKVEVCKAEVVRWDGMESKAGGYTTDTIHKLMEIQETVLAAQVTMAAFMKSKECKVVARKKKNKK